jgi:hypothetical protein
MKHRIAISIITVTLLAAFSGLALSKSLNRPVHHRLPDKSKHHAPSARAAAALRDGFAIFRLATPRSSRDDVALGESSAMAEPGAALDAARRVADLGSRAVWFAPSADGFCFLHRDLSNPREVGPGASCFSTATALRGDAWMSSGNTEDGGAAFVALVPDGVSSATVNFADGTSAVVPIQNNTLALRLTKPVQGYTYSDGRGTVNVAAGVE